MTLWSKNLSVIKCKQFYLLSFFTLLSLDSANTLRIYAVEIARNIQGILTIVIRFNNTTLRPLLLDRRGVSLPPVSVSQHFFLSLILKSLPP